VEITIGDLAALVDGKVLRGDPALVLTGVASLDDAGEADLAFFNNTRYYQSLLRAHAGAVLVPGEFPTEEIDRLNSGLIQVEDPTRAFSQVVEKFAPPAREFEAGIHSTAVVSETAEFDRAQVRIGPHVVIEDGVSIGNGTEIGAGTFIGEGAGLGSGCRVAANVTICGCCSIGDNAILHGGVVLGADGFGFEMVDGRREKVVHVGRVQIDDNVEIGANSTVDRARFGRTWIQEGVKIDNQVQIGHNCVIGEHAVIAAQTGIGGSTVLEARVTCGARVGMAGHLHLGHDIFIAGHSGVTSNLLANDTYMGFPAKPAKQMRKAMVLAGRLPQLLERIKKLEKKLGLGGGAE
jgi:UDP-3-O-[3-hydroxymyristoyl] glucosamine N-acyltransferase